MAQLHCGKRRRQVLKQKKNAWNEKGDLSVSAVPVLITCSNNDRPVDCCLKPADYITHNALSHITGGSLSDDMQLPLVPHEASHYFFTCVFYPLIENLHVANMLTEQQR